MNQNENFDYGAAIKEALKNRGRVKVLIAGKTGVGKSTLVNAVFGEDFAATGQGEPVTQEIKTYTKEGSALSIVDSKGLEMEDFERILTDLETHIEEQKRSPDPNDHIHVAWLCIHEASNRVESGEERFCEMARRQGIPVIVAITQAEHIEGHPNPTAEQFQAKVEEKLHLTQHVLRVRAKERVIIPGVASYPAYNLERLVQVTLECVPESHRNAFAAAQTVSLKIKKDRARGIIAGAAAGAAVIAATPIPFSDAAILIPAQIAMFASISYIYGLDITKTALASIVTGGLGSAFATVAGQSLVANVLKIIPFVGSVVGGAIAAITASTLTAFMGESYRLAIHTLMVANPDAPPSYDDITAGFKANIKSRTALNAAKRMID